MKFLLEAAAIYVRFQHVMCTSYEAHMLTSTPNARKINHI